MTRPTDQAFDNVTELKAVAGEGEWKLHRWRVSFRSGAEWHSAGEFVALTAAAAIDRAVDFFGPADEYQTEDIPWDAAPPPRRKAF